jgi:rubrerythrin
MSITLNLSTPVNAQKEVIMPQEMMHQDAMKLAIENEKKLMCFYRKAAKLVKNEEGRKVFARLAREKEEHITRFFGRYIGTTMGTLDEFLNSPCEEDKKIEKELRAIFKEDVRERHARKIALSKEEENEVMLRFKARHMVDPGVRSIFEQMADVNRKHYIIIESEYARTMAMPHDTDIDTFVRE